MEELIKVKNKNTDDILYHDKNAPKKYIDGMEYVRVKRSPNSPEYHLMLRDSLIFNWK